jgi:hypothetical protein
VEDFRRYNRTIFIANSRPLTAYLDAAWIFADADISARYVAVGSPLSAPWHGAMKLPSEHLYCCRDEEHQHERQPAAVI